MYSHQKGREWRIRSDGRPRWRQMLQNGRARPFGVELRYGTSVQKRLLPPCFWVAAHESGPAVMASRPEPAQPLDHTAPNSLKKTLFTVCFSHREARQRPTSSVFLVFYMHIYMNMNILCECVRMLLFFLILSEKYAR